MLLLKNRGITCYTVTSCWKLCGYKFSGLEFGVGIKVRFGIGVGVRVGIWIFFFGGGQKSAWNT